MRDSLFNTCKEWAPCKCEPWMITRLFYLQFMKLWYIISICYRHCYYLCKAYTTSFPVTKITTWDPLGNHRQKLARGAQRSLYVVKTIHIQMKPPSDCFLFKWWWASSSFSSFFFFPTFAKWNLVPPSKSTLSEKGHKVRITLSL